MSVAPDRPIKGSHEKPALGRKETDDQFPIPGIKGDHWMDCFGVLLKEDKDRYDVWKDEVQNLLLFAGLFSAVVTAFSVDSYKSLKPDSSQTMILLLAQIASRLDNSSTSVAPTAIPPFVPSSVSVRINIYWFLSLLLSLTTVLVGIVTMQWLREYQRYKDNITSKQAFAERNMRYESLKAWHVTQILTGLPLLLQAALLLFAIGIAEFLIDISHVVAIPCIVVVAFTVVFYGYTTISPAFQYSWYQIGNDSGDRVLEPCPYKSPQAWAFLSCTQVPVLSHIWKAILYIFKALLHIWKAFLNAFYQVYQHAHTAGFINSPPFRQGTESEIDSKRLPLSNWSNIDLIWLCKRHPHDKDNNYDAARGLARIVQLHSHLKTIAFSSYHCFSEIASESPVQEFVRHMSKILLHGEGKLIPWSELDQAGSLSLEEALIGFLNSLPQSSPKNPSHSLVWKHQTELLIRASKCSTETFLSGVSLLPRFVKGEQYLHENVGQWEDALKAQLKDLHQRLGMYVGKNTNERQFLAFLDQFSPRRKGSGPLPGIPRQTQGTLEIDRTRTRSFETSHEHIEIYVPPAFSEVIAGTGERELGAGEVFPQCTNPEPRKSVDSGGFLSPYSQSQPEHSHSRSLSMSTLSDDVDHGTVDMG